MAKPVPQDTDDLNAWFPRDNDQYANAQEQAEEVFAEKTRRLGVVVGGSLTKGLDVKLDRETEIEDLAVGRYVVVRGKQKRFFCMVTDVVLDSTNPSIRSDPPDLSDPFLRDIYLGTAAFGTVHVVPMLSIDANENEPKPVKTIPSHFMAAEIAAAPGIYYVFGVEDPTHFHIGSPPEARTTPCKPKYAPLLY